MSNVAEVEQTEFTIDELTGAARERAMTTLYEWAIEYNWYRDVQEDWADNVLPNDWCIYGVDKDRMYFDTDRAQEMCLTDGRLRLKELVTKKPEMFTNLALRVACEQGWIYNPIVRVHRNDTRGVEAIECEAVPDFTGTPFDGIDAFDFWELIWPSGTDELEVALSEHVCNAAKACLKAMEEEYEYLTNEDALLENARANEYKFDSEGKLL